MPILSKIMTEIFFLLPLIFLTYLYFVRNNEGKGFFILMILFLFIAVSFREPTCKYNDVHNYLRNYKYGLKMVLNYELFFAYLQVVLINFKIGFQWLLIITNAISLLVLSFAICRSDKKIVHVLALYYILTYYFIGYNVMRQMLGVSFVLLGYTYLNEEKVKKFVVCVLIAFFFHHSCIFTLVCLLFYKKDVFFNHVHVCFWLIVTFLLGAIKITPLVLNKLSWIIPYYVRDDLSKYAEGTNFSLSKIMLNLMFMYMYTRIDNRNLYLKIVFVGILLFNLFAYSDSIRIAYGFTTAQIFLYADTKDEINSFKTLDKVIIYGYALFLFYYMFCNNIVGVQNYEFCDGKYF